MMHDEKMAREIMTYLQENPYSGDSIEGISKWWLMRQHITETVEAVQQVLEHLSSTGFLYERRMANGRRVYFAAHHDAAALMENENNFEGGFIQ